MSESGGKTSPAPINGGESIWVSLSWLNACWFITFLFCWVPLNTPGLAKLLQMTFSNLFKGQTQRTKTKSDRYSHLKTEIVGSLEIPVAIHVVKLNF